MTTTDTFEQARQNAKVAYDYIIDADGGLIGITDDYADALDAPQRGQQLQAQALLRKAMKLVETSMNVN